MGVESSSELELSRVASEELLLIFASKELLLELEFALEELEFLEELLLEFALEELLLTLLLLEFALEELLEEVPLTEDELVGGVVPQPMFNEPDRVGAVQSIQSAVAKVRSLLGFITGAAGGACVLSRNLLILSSTGVFHSDIHAQWLPLLLLE